jgi:hypothetical protein
LGKNKTISYVKKAVFLGSLLCLLVVSQTACKNSDDQIVAKMGDEILSESELEYRILQSPDSNKEQLIEHWGMRSLFLNKFDSLSTEQQEEIIYKVKDYKASLIRYEVENRLIEQRLDTVVTEQEMLNYYELNKRDFELSDFIVKVLYIKLPSNAPDLDKINRLYLLKQPKDTLQVTEYANKYAANFFYNKEKWIYFDDILKEIPLDNIDKEKFILSKTKTSFEENGFIYFLNILDYRLKNDPSPFSLERNHIRQRILTNRIATLRDELNKKLIEDAQQSYEIYNSNH